jgi:hypothetical protein
MSSVRRVLLTIAVGAALGAGPAVATPAMANHNNHNNRTTQLGAILTDNGVVNGDEDGWGVVNLRVRSNGVVCYSYFIRRVEDPENLAVYRGGDKKFTLANHGGIGQGCRYVGWATAQGLRNWPSQYYVKVDGDDGSIRGRLHYSGGGGGNHDW